MPVIVIGHGIQAQLRRSSRRRTIAIKVQGGEVVVSAPIQAPLLDIQRFVTQKALWVQRHLQRQQHTIEHTLQRQYLQGEKLFFMGEALILTEAEGFVREPQLDWDQRSLALPRACFDLATADRKHIVAQWYSQQALSYLEQRVSIYSNSMKLSPKAIKVRHYKTRWGSCNSRGELQFNWMIMMAKAKVIDYVVVHELAHLQHFNHSPAFWRLVEGVMPGHQEHRAWLKRQSHIHW